MAASHYHSASRGPVEITAMRARLDAIEAETDQ